MVILRRNKKENYLHIMMIQYKKELSKIGIKKNKIKEFKKGKRSVFLFLKFRLKLIKVKHKSCQNST